MIDSMGEAVALTAEQTRDLTGAQGALATALVQTAGNAGNVNYAASLLTPALTQSGKAAGGAADETEALLGELGHLPDELDAAAGATDHWTESQKAVAASIEGLRFYPIDDDGGTT